MAALVVAAHGKAPAVELLGHVRIAPSVLAQTMHYQYHRTGRCGVGLCFFIPGIEWPVVHGQVFTVARRERRQHCEVHGSMKV